MWFLSCLEDMHDPTSKTRSDIKVVKPPRKLIQIVNKRATCKTKSDAGQTWCLQTKAAKALFKNALAFRSAIFTSVGCSCLSNLRTTNRCCLICCPYKAYAPVQKDVAHGIPQLQLVVRQCADCSACCTLIGCKAPQKNETE